MQVIFPELFRKVSLKLFETLDTPRALSCALLLKYGEYGQLVSLTVDPRNYEDAEPFYRDSVAVDWLRKCAGLPTGIDTPAVAHADFLSCERNNARTNARLSPFIHGGPFDGVHDERVGGFLRSVKKVIRDILGPLPKELNPRFGPGSTFEDRGRRCLLPDKMSSRPTITSRARCLLDLWQETAWSRALLEAYPHKSDPKTVRGNRFTTVPKDAKKDRGIAIEPSLNVYYQLGVGGAIRSRLKRAGIDLNDGQILHRQVACAASLPPLWRDGEEMATIDLSSASDTVSRKLVQLLLPEEWFELLHTLSSPLTCVNGRWHYLEKFSSMGNGFTFELETLLFLGISLAVGGRSCHPGVNVFVYGDDIIVPTRIAPSLLSVLRFLGFKSNDRKTFLDSHFRESCGGDFFKGQPVRAHFVKELPSEPQHWVAIANGLDRVQSNLRVMGSSLDLKRVWFLTLDSIPSHVRSCRGPSELGDLVIRDEEAHWATRIRHGIRFVRVYRPIGISVPLLRWRPEIQLAYALYQAGSTIGVSSRPFRGVSPRDSVSGYKQGWTAFS
jgi:hypothetical protein